MKKANGFLILIVTALTHIPALFAQSGSAFTFDPPILTGTGCPQGSAAVVLSPDQSTISLLYDQFEAKVPNEDGINDNDVISEDNPQRMGKNNPQISHKVCNILISANLPDNQMLSMLEVSFDFRGFTYAEKGTRALFKAIFNEKKGLGVHFNQKVFLENRLWKADAQTPVSEDWTLESSKKIRLPSSCARAGDRKVQLSLKNILMAVIHKSHENVLPRPSSQISMDSTDIRGAMKFKLHLKPCAGGNGRGR